MRFWKNTNTLDGFMPELLNLVSPEEADVAVIGSKPIDLGQHPRLRGLFKCGVGVDNVPFYECEARGISIGLPSAQTSDFIFEETANFTTHLILTMLYATVGDLETWVKTDRPLLNRRRALLIGQGNIGKRVKAKLAPLITVTSYDIAVQAEEELEPLVRQAEVVSLHLPLTVATEGWFDETKLSWMQDGAALVNTARGAIVDEMSLLKEIEQGRLWAAFDVFWKEPYYGPLRAYHPERFLMTPHVASTCADFLAGLAADLRVFVQGLMI